MAASETNPTGDRPEGITCDSYVRGEGKRCGNYLPNGACSLPGEFMCSEWLKKNGQRQPSPQADERPKDLFGHPLPDPPTKKQPKPQPKREKPVAVVEPSAATEPPSPPRRGLTTEDIESFKALRVEVCLHSEDFGDLWLVPAYTGQPRKEITPEHAATVLHVLEAFPGSRVVAFDKQPPAEPANEGSPA